MRRNKYPKGSGKPLHNTRGITMVSVIVAFVVLMLTMGMFVQVLRLSLNMIARAETLRKEKSEIMREYYENKTSTQTALLGQPEQEFALTDGRDSFTLHITQYRSGTGTQPLVFFGGQEASP